MSNLLAHARQVPVAEGGHGGEGREHPRAEVVDGGPGGERSAVIGAVHDVAHAAEGLDQHVVAALFGLGSLGPEGGQGHVDDRRVDGLHSLVADPVAVEVGSLEGRQDDVGPAQEGVEHRPDVGVVEVEADGPLPRVDGGVGLRLIGGQLGQAPHGVTLGRLDLDHVGPHAGQEAAAVGNGGVLGQLQHPDPGQRPRWRRPVAAWRPGRVRFGRGHDRRALTRSATVLPSARPATSALMAFMAWPMSLLAVQPPSASIDSTRLTSSSSVSLAGR